MAHSVEFRSASGKVLGTYYGKDEYDAARVLVTRHQCDVYIYYRHKVGIDGFGCAVFEYTAGDRIALPAPR